MARTRDSEAGCCTWRGGYQVIAHVSGVVAAVNLDSAVIEVGGVGILIHCGPRVLATLRIGEMSTLRTSLVVREDSLTLYGFTTDDERSMFELVQTASGVGPRLAQAILAVLNPDDVRRAITAGDTGALTQVSGIGKKGAERLILELKDRIGPVAAGSPPAGNEQVVSGLVALGWPQSTAELAAARATVAVGDDAPIATVLKHAIQLLGLRS